MSATIRTPSADYGANPAAIAPPTTRGLIGFGFPNRTMAKVGRNLLTGEAINVVGLPAVKPGYSELTGSTKYLDTDAPETAAVTFLAVAKTPVTDFTGAARPAIMGNQNDQAIALLDPARTSTGCLMYYASATTIIWSATRITGPTTITTSNWTLTVPAGAIAAWSFLSARADDTTQAFKDHTHNVDNIAAVAAGRTRWPARGNIRVGSDGKNFAGRVDVAFWAEFNVVLTDAEVEAWATFARAYLDDDIGTF